MINEDNKYILTREELKNTFACNFKHGDLIICGKYYIHIKYGSYTSPSLLTTVNTRYDLRDLKMSKHPQYIRDFIEGRPETGLEDFFNIDFESVKKELKARESIKFEDTEIYKFIQNQV